MRTFTSLNVLLACGLFQQAFASPYKYKIQEFDDGVRQHSPGNKVHHH